MSAWMCDLHRVWTTSDCPRCDDEQIAELEAQRNAEWWAE